MIALGEAALVIGLGFAALCGLVWLVITLMQMAKSGKLSRLAEEKLAQGDWKGAAALYKEAIVERLDSPGALEKLVGRLDRIYRDNGVEEDLGRIRDCPRLVKEIWKTKVKPKEKGRLTGKLVRETKEFLDSLP
jgi:hypothetical protein